MTSPLGAEKILMEQCLTVMGLVIVFMHYCHIYSCIYLKITLFVALIEKHCMEGHISQNSNKKTLIMCGWKEPRF